MESIFIHPDKKLLTKMIIQWLLGAVLMIGMMVGLGVLIALEEAGPRAAQRVAFWIAGGNLLWLLPALLLTGFYVNSLQYEIQPDEVIVRAGIITKSVKHVPYRTVTNIEIKRGPFDRLFGLGTLKIQTAGMSGESGVEEALIGLPNVEEVYETVAATLRRFRGGMAPTQAGDEPVGSHDQAAALAALLEEVRRIREAVADQ